MFKDNIIKYLKVFVLVMLVKSSLFAGTTGTSALNFLKINDDARTSAMADSNIASVYGPNSIFINPSAITLQKRMELGLSYYKWFADLTYGVFSYSLRNYDWGVLGLGMQYLGSANIEGYDNNNISIGSYRFSDMAINIAYAYRYKKAAAGINIKLINEVIDDSSEYVYAADLGLLLELKYKKQPFNVGFVYQNLGTKIKYHEEEDPLPSNMGIGILLPIELKGKVLNIAVDAELPSDDTLNSTVGIEYYLYDKLALRSGYRVLSSNVNKLSAGLGFSPGRWQFDYAWTPFGDLGYVHRVGIALEIGSAGRRRLAEGIPVDKRKNVAVAALTPKNVSQMDASIVGDFLRTAMVQTQMFNVLDRENMERILSEQAFQATGCTTQECAVKIGKLLNMQWMVVGSFSKIMGTNYISVDLIDVETGRIIGSESAECKTIAQLQEKTKEIAENLTDYIR